MKRTPHRIIGANDALKSHEKNSASPVHVNAKAQSPEVKSSPSPHSGKKSPSPSPQGKPSPQHVKRKHYRNKGNSPPSRHAKSPPHSPTEHPSPIRFKKAVVPFPLALDVHASPLPEPLLTPHMTPATLVSESRLDGSPNRRTIGRLHVACALTVLVACVVVGVLVHIMIIRSVSSSERQACKLEVCQTYATYVDQSVNASVDPCKSFYHYVCDGWNSKNTLSVRRKQLDSYISLVHHSVNVHQKAVPTSGQSGDQKAIAFYRSCTDVQKRTENELPEIKRILTKANLTWPHNSSNVNLLGAVFYVTRVLDLSVLINVEARMNATDATVSFSKPDYLQDVIKRRDDLIRRKEYKIFVTRLMEHFATAGEPVIAYEDQLQLEETPFRLLRDVAEEDDDGGPPTMYEMEIMTSIAGYTQDRWKRALEEHLGIPGNLKIHIEFRSARFTAVIFSIMSHLEESLLQFLAGYLLAIQVSMFANYELLNNLYRNNRELADRENLKFCFGVTMKYMGNGYLYHHEHQWPTSAELRDLSKIAASVEETFRSHYGVSTNVSLVKALRRFTDGIRQLHMDKAYQHFPNMGSKFITNLQAAVKALKMSPGEDVKIPYVNFLGNNDRVYYHLNTSSDDLYFYPYTFIPPLYRLHYSVGTYAGLGTELSFAYAALVMQQRVDNDTLSCLSREHPQVADIVDLKDLFFESVALDAAWNSWKSADPGVRATRLGSSGLTEDQLFFFFWCYKMCSKTLQWERRCNEPLRTSPMFRSAFRCAQASFTRADPCIRSRRKSSSGP